MEDGEFVRVAREVRKKIYEEDWGADLGKTADFLWNESIPKLMNRFDISSELETSLLSALHSLKSQRDIARNVDTIIEKAHLDSSLYVLIDSQLSK